MDVAGTPSQSQAGGSSPPVSLSGYQYTAQNAYRRACQSFRSLSAAYAQPLPYFLPVNYQLPGTNLTPPAQHP
eukprot:3029271-Rhodomonas_salina.1